MPLPKPKIDWRPILLEASFVVLGVVLALAANEWRRSYVERQNGATALQSIRDELQANRQAVYNSLTYHVELSDTLSTLVQVASRSNPASGVVQPDARLFARGFFNPATLLHTAWDAAAATDAVRHMRYSDVLRLAQIYEEQDRYRRQSEQVGQLVYSHMFSYGFQGMLQNHANLGTILGTFWYRECQLLSRYDEVLSQVGGWAEADSLAVPERCRAISARSHPR